MGFVCQKRDWAALRFPASNSSFHFLVVGVWIPLFATVPMLLGGWLWRRHGFATDLPLRRFFRAVLNLPLAVPSYVSGFVVVAVAGPRGWLQQWLEPLGVERLPEIYEALNRINDLCWDGAFTYWHLQRLMVWRYGLVLSGGQIAGSEQVDRLIGSSVATAERFYPALQLVSWANQSPEQAMNVAMAEAYGRA